MRAPTFHAPCEPADFLPAKRAETGIADGHTQGLKTDRAVTNLDGPWWLVHTKPRNEKALARDLNRMGINHFLPQAVTHRRVGKQVTATELPLFPSYLFLCGADEDRYATLRTGRTVRVLRVPDQNRLRDELAHIERMTSSGAPLDVYPGIRTGRRCRVSRGSLEGLEGVVLRRGGRCRVYVAVDILGQSAEVEIDPALLEIIE